MYDPKMIWQYLIEDVTSYNRKKIYAKAGEKVYVIANHSPVALVISERGEKFSTLFTNLKPKP
jgi:hypothetical protein